MTPHDVAELLRLDYREQGKLVTLASLKIAGVEARIVQADEPDPVLLITGSNERGDWHFANFRWWPVPHTFSTGTYTWHRGFLRHGGLVYSFARGWLGGGKTIGLIAGHSLGAAAAQIAGVLLGIRTYAFASPKPLWGSKQPENAKLVTNWCGKTDLVCKVPPVGFSHVGDVVWLAVKQHEIEAYRDGLAHSDA